MKRPTVVRLLSPGLAAAGVLALVSVDAHAQVHRCTDASDQVDAPVTGAVLRLASIEIMRDRAGFDGPKPFQAKDEKHRDPQGHE